MTALARQHGGSHYSRMQIQPFEFSLRNGWDGAAHSILKYISRYRDKGGVLDLQKALHIGEIRMQLWGAWLSPTREPSERMPMWRYIEANGITGEDAEALTALEEWVEDHERVDSYDFMVEQLSILIATNLGRMG